MTTTHASRSEADTIRIARDLAAALGTTRAAVLLYGELGAGKTAFVRGLVEGAGGCPADVSSPTFVLMQEYPGRRLVHHVDLYRLRREDVADLEPLLAELLASDAIVAIEWADRLLRPPESGRARAHRRPGVGTTAWSRSTGSQRRDAPSRYSLR